MHESVTKRVWQFDSIKGLFIFLVVLGHLIGGGGTACTVSSITHYAIYAVHMPMFILITGILSKKKTSVKKVFANYIIPYIVFDVLYMAFEMIAGTRPNWNILVPTFLYWYILCIAIMKILYSKIDSKVLLIGSFILSIVVAFCVPETVWRWFSFGRVALLFPIFIVGVNLSLDRLNELNKRKYIPFALGILSVGVVIILAVCRAVPIDWATHDYYDNVYTLVLKYIFMTATVGIFILLFVVIPKWGFLQQWGKNSVVIYLVHPFPVLMIRFLASKLALDGLIGFLAMIVCALGITAILSLNCIRNVYDRFFKKVQRIIKLEA